MSLALFPAGGALHKIGEQVGNGSSGVLEFANIPQQYRALWLSVVGRTTAAVTVTGAYLSFEVSPTAGAYNHQALRGNGATATAVENPGTADSIQVGAPTGTSGSANVPGASLVYIPEYANTSLFKTVLVQSLAVTTLGASGMFSDTYAGLWESTAAIDRIRLTLVAGAWTTSSRATLYGID